jgi:uncharacterized protein YecA (UPF0149 family)
VSDRVTLPLRIAPELHTKLKALAEVEHRSLNAFIAYNLARLVAEREAMRAAEARVAQAIMQSRPLLPRVPKARPNDPCPCGSGTKYKRCHGARR